MSKAIDLTGQRFGYLLVIERRGVDKARQVLWFCRCDCGGNSIVRGTHLRSGNIVSCGCGEKGRKCASVTARNNAYTKSWRARHLEVCREWNRRAKKREVEKMSDAYISAKLGVRLGEAPKELIEAKRAHLRVKRLLKEIGQ